MPSLYLHEFEVKGILDGTITEILRPIRYALDKGFRCSERGSQVKRIGVVLMKGQVLDKAPELMSLSLAYQLEVYLMGNKEPNYGLANDLKTYYIKKATVELGKE